MLRPMTALAEMSVTVAELLAAQGGEEFCIKLLQGIRRFVPVDEVSFIVYEPNSLPTIEFSDPELAKQNTLEAYLSSAFLLDPYYVAATKDNRSGYFELAQLAPKAFRKSEYYKVYYQHSDLSDESGYLIPIWDQGFVNIALGRTGSGRFSPQDHQVLRELEPLVMALCAGHWQTKELTNPQPLGLRARLETALANFGTSVLTQREFQVVQLILVGHSTKSMAEALSVSFETIKLHRKHAYAKLHVSSQSELFYLFIDSLMDDEAQQDGDPLTAYLAKPKETRLAVSDRSG